MLICSIEGCEATVLAKGYCGKHYKRIQKHGANITLINKDNVPKNCTYPGCDKKHMAHGYCMTHYGRIWKKGTLELEREMWHTKCEVEGCDRPHAAKGMCKKHHRQMRKYGHTYLHSIKDPNYYHIHDGLCYIECRSKDNKTIRVVGIIDVADAELVLKYKWRYASGGYLNTGKKEKRMTIHKLITGYEMTDHIDGDPANNVRSNLRPCTSQQNSMNMKAVGAISYKGVSWNKASGKYYTGIKIMGKHIYGGRYNTAEEAALRYNELAKQYHGEFARLNEVPPQCQ